MERLVNLEEVIVNDNKIKSLPVKIGNLKSLLKLYLHDNRIICLPRELALLTNLKEFSLEWFLYTRPSNSKI